MFGVHIREFQKIKRNETLMISPEKLIGIILWKQEFIMELPLITQTFTALQENEE